MIGKKRILVVDDEPDFASIVKKNLENPRLWASLRLSGMIAVNVWPTSFSFCQPQVFSNI